MNHFLILIAVLAGATIRPTNSLSSIARPHGNYLPPPTGIREKVPTFYIPKPTQARDILLDVAERSLLKQMNLITFDLDDTLFPVNKVVRDANDALVHAIQAVGGKDPSIKRFNENMKKIQQDFDMRGEDITYSELGRLGVAKELEICMAESMPRKKSEDIMPRVVEVAEHLKESVYDAWLREGANSAEQNLFPDTVDSIRQIKEINPDVVVGAITNGRGSPLEMHDTLAPYFDFRVSGEDKDVFPERKPSRKIFDVALAKAMTVPRTNRKYLTPGSRWVHVGDGLVNDVKGAAMNGAFAIWLDSKYLSKDEESVFFSTATEEEMRRWELEEKKAKKMAVARIECLSQICETLAGIKV